AVEIRSRPPRHDDPPVGRGAGDGREAEAGGGEGGGAARALQSGAGSGRSAQAPSPGRENLERLYPVRRAVGPASASPILTRPPDNCEHAGEFSGNVNALLTSVH